MRAEEQPSAPSTVPLEFSHPSEVSHGTIYSEVTKVAGSKRRSFSSQGGLLNRMFGSSGSPPKEGSQPDAPETIAESTTPSTADPLDASKISEEGAGGEKRSGNGSPPGRATGDNGATVEKKRRSSGVGQKASSLLASAKSSLHFSPNPNSAGFMRAAESTSQTPLQKLASRFSQPCTSRLLCETRRDV